MVEGGAGFAIGGGTTKKDGAGCVSLGKNLRTNFHVSSIYVAVQHRTLDFGCCSHEMFLFQLAIMKPSPQN